MNIKAHPSLGNLANLMDKTFGKNDAIAKNVQFQMGPASDSEFGTDSHAPSNPIFVGDSAHIWGKEIDPMTESMLKTHPERVDVKFVPVSDEKGNSGYKARFTTIPAAMMGTTDAKKIANDAVNGMISGQFFSPWNVSYFTEILRQPLSFSNFNKVIPKESGTNPWAEIFTMYLEEYAGWAQIGGRLADKSTNDVNVVNGIMSAPIINLSATYSNTLEEQKRAEVRGNPFGRQSMNQKVSYRKYALDFLSDTIGYYGVPELNIDGILTVNPIKIWSGDSIKAIYQNAPATSTTRGSQIYRMLSDLLIQFLTRADFKFDHIRIVCSPEAYGYLLAAPYSDTYDAQAVMTTFTKNFNQKEMPEGKKVTIDWVEEPMLKASCDFNADPQDYFCFIASTVGTGPNNEKQKILKYAEPLAEFVYPVIPGMYNQQHKMMKRVAGLFAPVPQAIEVYKGLGVNNA
jgi:hypothetical protein